MYGHFFYLEPPTLVPLCFPISGRVVAGKSLSTAPNNGSLVRGCSHDPCCSAPAGPTPATPPRPPLLRGIPIALNTTGDHLVALAVVLVGTLRLSQSALGGPPWLARPH